MADDSVNRESLDYWTGWLEALRIVGQMIIAEETQAKKYQLPGLELANKITKDMYDQVWAKMRKDRPLNMNKVDECMAKMRLDMSKDEV